MLNKFYSMTNKASFCILCLTRAFVACSVQRKPDTGTRQTSGFAIGGSGYYGISSGYH